MKLAHAAEQSPRAESFRAAHCDFGKGQQLACWCLQRTQIELPTAFEVSSRLLSSPCLLHPTMSTTSSRVLMIFRPAGTNDSGTSRQSCAIPQSFTHRERGRHAMSGICPTNRRRSPSLPRYCHPSSQLSPQRTIGAMKRSVFVVADHSPCLFLIEEAMRRNEMFRTNGYLLARCCLNVAKPIRIRAETIHTTASGISLRCSAASKTV